MVFGFRPNHLYSPTPTERLPSLLLFRVPSVLGHFDIRRDLAVLEAYLAFGTVAADPVLVPGAAGLRPV